MDSKIIETATLVILHSGNARALVSKALEAAYDNDLDEAYKKIKKAQEEISTAHQVQTEVIQSEARGQGLEFSLLMTHAQDSLMVTMSEINMAKQMLKLYEKLYS